jgi:hypothetical protein
VILLSVPARKAMRVRKFITPFLPFAIAAAGYYPALGLRSPITAWPTAETSYFFGFLFASLIWLIFEISFVLRRGTRIEDLALDCLLQTIVAIIFAGMGGYYLAGGFLFGQDSLGWWFAIPMSVAILDAIISNAYVVGTVRSAVEDLRPRTPPSRDGASATARAFP